MNNWWTLTAEECVASLRSDAQRGLDPVEADRRLRDSGPNALAEHAIKSPWLILWEQLTGIMVIILIVAAVVAGCLGEVADTVVIAVIVVLNALLGLSQEYRAEQAMAALKRLAVPTVRVRRGNDIQEVSSRNLVTGDVLLLEAGNLVPADGRLVATANLRIQEAALTGESEPVEKTVASLPDAATALGDRRNMIHMGTVVTYGRGTAVVTATGMRTELGAIATLIQTVKRDATPLQKRLEQLGRGLAIVALLLVAAIFAEGIWRGGTSVGNLKLMFLTAISMAVAAVPEGLPAIVTIALALGAQRMLRRQALIRKLLAVETLGSVTVICSDKTGTLTENRMTVTTVHVGTSTLALSAETRRLPGVTPLLAAGALCNDATLKTAQPGEQTLSVMGDPTEAALVKAAAEADLRKDALDALLPRVEEIPFDSDRKRMTTVHRVTGNAFPDGLPGILPSDRRRGTHLALCKGAPDGLLGLCTATWTAEGIQPMTAAARAEVKAANDQLAQRGMRVLGVAFRTVDDAERGISLEQDLVFLGLVGMIDPPRQEVKAAVHTCRTAGIRPVMITGDHPLTAREIARQLDLDADAAVLTGAEIDRLTLEALRERVDQVTVYARVSPEHKLRIVEALQQRGHVVAMTGDGVNDAPALRKADIGVAMGVSGTDVAKEAADMVLRDDNFATIVAAVEEGRAIYDNIRKFIRYLLSTNSGELWTMLLAPFLGLPLPLLPIQILWMNLVTDGLPALALSVEPAERDIMRRPPRHTSDNIFGDGLGWQILRAGTLMAVVTLGTGCWYAWSGHLDLRNAHDVAYYRTLLFTIMASLQMGNVLAIRSHRESLFTLGLGSNWPLLGAVLLTLTLQVALVYVPWLQRCFQTVPLSAHDLTICLMLSTAIFWAVELEKLLMRRRARRPPLVHGGAFSRSTGATR